MAYVRETGSEIVDWNQLTESRNQRQAFVSTAVH
jgi:hypothetical protein